VTKTVQKLVARKFLKVDPAPGDARSKHLTITPKGLEIHARAVAAFVPRFADVFQGWDDKDMEELFQRLDRLKVWMDSKGRE
jgi:DNA-binding MarR family transcriptional regulator